MYRAAEHRADDSAMGEVDRIFTDELGWMFTRNQVREYGIDGHALVTHYLSGKPPVLLLERPRSEARLLCAISNSAALLHEGALSPTSVYGQVPDHATPLQLAGRRAAHNVVILDQVQISAGIPAQDKPTRLCLVPRTP
jgi:hypothetical protein